MYICLTVPSLTFHFLSMSAIVQRIAAQAAKTFADVKNKTVFHQHLTKLREMTQRVTTQDLSFDEKLVRNRENFKPETGKAPVTYVHLWEDHIFTMGIFVLKNGTSLPLHDHPGMHGIIKVIHGSLSIKTYSLIKDAPHELPTEVKAELSPWSTEVVNYVQSFPTKTVDTSSEPCTLYPDQGNFHEITATNGPAAFLDILSPPYDHGHNGIEGERICRYYRVLNPKQKNLHMSASASQIEARYLIEIPQPMEFWCDAAMYRGPAIDPYT